MELVKRKTNQDTINGFTYEVVNVVATASFSESLDLSEIQALENAHYDPQSFAGLVMKMRRNKGTLLVFRTGKVVITGAKHPKFLKDITDEFIAHLNEQLDIELSPPDINVENIVVNGRIEDYINLNKASLVLTNAMFEPEVFCGLVQYIHLNASEKQTATALLFGNGKILLLGITSMDDIESIAMHLVEDLIAKELTFKVKPEPTEQLTFI